MTTFSRARLGTKTNGQFDVQLQQKISHWNQHCNQHLRKNLHDQEWWLNFNLLGIFGSSFCAFPAASGASEGGSDGITAALGNGP